MILFHTMHGVSISVTDMHIGSYIEFLTTKSEEVIILLCKNNLSIPQELSSWSSNFQYPNKIYHSSNLCV